MGGRRRRRSRSGQHAEQPRAAEGGTSSAIKVAEGVSDGGSGERTSAVVTAEGEGLLGDKGGGGLSEGGSSAQGESIDGANDEGGAGARAGDGQPRTVVTLEQREGHACASGGGPGDGGESDGDGGESDRVLDSLKGGCFLIDSVLKWRIQDVMNADLYKEKVKKLPSEFTSLESYIEMQSILLLEETRATIHAEILDTARTTSYHPLSVSCAGTLSTYYIDVDLETLDGCTHVVEDGDILLLSNQSAREVDHMSGHLGIATGVGRDNCFRKAFHVLISEYHTNFDCEEINKVSFITNIMEAISISKSITSIELGGSIVAKSILKFDEQAERKCTICGGYASEEYVHPNDLNEEQRNAVDCIVSKLWCPHKKAVDLVWGPPGSGKTKVAIAITHSLLHWRFRLLVCVPRDKDILRFLKNFKELFPSFDLNKILVLNNLDGKEGTNNCSRLAERSLESRTQELYCGIYLWQSWMKEISFLLELKPFCRDSCDHEGRPTCSKNKLAVFCFKTFKEKFAALAVDLRICSQALINSLSAVCLSENVLENINKLLNDISLFEDLLLHNSLTDCVLQRAFEFANVLPFTSEDTEYDIAPSLNASRKSCVQLIEILLNSIQLPQLEDRNELEEFCIRHSSVVICTPASSARLHGLKSDSDAILLVDDAAQIKESDILIPLSIASRHVVLLGDHHHLQPLVTSEPGQEFTWAGRPKNTKYILARLRDQKGAADTCSFQASLGVVESLNKFQCACLDPPQDFKWDLSVDNLKSQYESQEDTEFGSEDMKKRGKHRLESSLEILKVHGVTGSNKVECKDRAFKISSYEKVDVNDPENITSLVKNGNIMVGYFRLSRNYFYLKPTEAYWYDAAEPFIHAKSFKPVSHVVMVIGDGKRRMRPAEGTSKTMVRRHVGIQNSEGKRFGVDGVGKVLRRSLRALYRIEI